MFFFVELVKYTLVTRSLLLMQPFGFRLHFVPGPQPTTALGCAVTQKVLEEAASLALWTHPLQAQVGPGRKPFFSDEMCLVYIRSSLKEPISIICIGD